MNSWQRQFQKKKLKELETDRWIINEIKTENGLTFITTHEGRNCNKFLPYEDSQKISQKLGIKSNIEYVEFHRAGKLPNGMPSHPPLVYSEIHSKWNRVSKKKSIWREFENENEFEDQKFNYFEKFRLKKIKKG